MVDSNSSVALLFVFNGAINGLDCHLHLNESRAGVARLFALKRRSDDFCKFAAVFDQTFAGLFQQFNVLLAHDHLLCWGKSAIVSARTRHANVAMQWT